MKKALVNVALIASILLVSLAGIGCSFFKRDNPSRVAEQFCIAVGKGDAVAYGKLSTKETAEVITLFKNEFKRGVNARKGIAKAKETIKGTRAVVELTFKNGSADKLDLVKTGGKWKVTMSQGLSGFIPIPKSSEEPEEPGSSEHSKAASETEAATPGEKGESEPPKSESVEEGHGSQADSDSEGSDKKSLSERGTH